MKKGLFALTVLALVGAMLVPAVAGAAKPGMIGVGYFRTQAPIGIRYWVNEQIGIDIGLGLSSREYTYGTPVKSETKMSFALDAGVPFVLVSADQASFFIRPGVLFESEPNAGSPDDNATTIGISGSLGVEYFLSSRFSLEAAHGLIFTSYDPGIKGSDSSTQFYSEEFGISHIGFHFYFMGQ